MATKQFLTDADFEDAAPLKPVQTGVLGRAGDLGLSVLKGAMAVPEFLVGVANIPTGGKAGKAVEEAGVRFKDAKQILDDQMSVAGQLAQRKYERAEGFTGKVGAAIQNPSIISSGIAESAGPMGAGMAVGRGLMAVAPRVLGGLAGAIGEGVVGAGSAAEQIRQQTADGELTGKQAALAGATGLATTAFGALGNKIGNKLGVGDIDNALIGGAASQAPAKQAGLAKRVAGGAFSEGVLEELPQSVSEQMLQNVALDRDTMQGVDSAAAMGLVTGGAMGAGFGILNRGQAPAAEQPPAQPPVAPTTTPGAPPAATPPTDPTLGQSLTGTPMADLIGGGGLTGGANPLQAGLSTLTSNNQMYPGMNTEPAGYTVDPETGAIIQAEPVGARQMTEPAPQQRQKDVLPPFVPEFSTEIGAAPTKYGNEIDMQKPEFDTSGLRIEYPVPAITPAQRMGLNPANGPLSAAATIAANTLTGSNPAGMLGRASDPLLSGISDRRVAAENDAQRKAEEDQRRFEQARSGTLLNVPETGVTQRPLSAERGMELVKAKANGRTLLPQEDGFLVALRKEMGDDAYANMAQVAKAPFLFKKQERTAILKPNQDAIAAWDAANAALPSTRKITSSGLGVVTAPAQQSPQGTPNATQAAKTQQAAPQQQGTQSAIGGVQGGANAMPVAEGLGASSAPAVQGGPIPAAQVQQGVASQVTAGSKPSKADNLAALQQKLSGQTKPTPATPPAQTKATPAPEAGPTNQGATNGQGQETLLKAEQPTGADVSVSGAPVEKKTTDTAKPGGAIEKIRKAAQSKVDAAPAQPILTSPTKADIESQQARAEQAAKAKAAQDKADAARAAKERERKEVAAASVAAADTFELGQDAMANLTGQNDLQFSRAAAKEVRNLVTLHNLSEENLMYAGKMGGIPAPSIGITKVETPFGGFGGITLIAQKDLIDPESGVPVYDRDAWTARFPKLNFKKVKAKVADAFYERMQSVRDFGSDGGQFMSMLFEELRNSNVQAPDKITSLFTRYTAPKMLYAQEVLGKTIKPPMRDIKSETPFGHAKSWRDFVAKNYKAGMTEQQEKEFSRLAAVAARAAMAEINTENKARADERTARMLDSSMNGYLDRYISENYGMNAGILDRAVRDVKSFGKKEVDPMKLDEAVRKVVPTDDAGYNKWIANLVEPLFEAPTITLRGAEVPATLDNIVAAMTIGKTAGAEKSMTFGAGKAASMLSKQFKSIDEIKAARDRVVSTASESEGKKSTEALISEYQNHVSEFYTGKDWKGNIDTWAALDSSLEALTKAGRSPTDEAMKIALQRAGFKRVDAKGIILAKQALEALRDASTNYFEAKPQRAVRLNEFKGAVVPKGTSAEAIALLEENGITVEAHGNAEGAREKAIQKLAKKLDGKTGNVIFSRAKEQPLTPAPTIRAAITKAYGNLLSKLEAKGLVTIAQTEREAIEAAAQARADKTGGDVEQIKRSMLASVQASRGTISGMPETKAPGPQGDAQQGAVQGNSVINAGIDFVSEIERLSEKHGRVYIRWSPGAEGDMSGEQASRDFVSGATHAGLSAIEITDEMHPVVIAKRLSEYSFLRMQDRRSKPFVYLAERVGTDSDGYASIKPKNVLLESSPDVLKAIDAKLAEVMDAMDDVQRESDKLEKYPGHAAVMQRLDAAQARLAKLIPNEQSAPSSQGVDVKYSANGNIEGFFDKQTGKSFLVADNLTASSAPGTLMHEVGIHMAAGGKLEPLFKRAGSILKTGSGNAFIQRVKARMARAGETSDEEAAAYIVTEHENDRAKAPITIGKWLADLAAAVRAWLFRNGIVLKAEQLTVADIAAVARANARSMARGGPNGGPGGQSFQRGTNAGMPENKAPGPQGDAQQGAVQGNAVAVSRQIAQAIQDDNDPYADYGLRVIPPEADVVVRPGDKLPPSNQWDDGTDTGEPLNGTSAARIDGDTEDAALKAIRLIGAHGKPGPNGYYYGDQVVLVKGEKVGAGEDVGEILLSDAVVVATWRKPDKGNSEVAPNDQSAPSDGPSGGQAFSRQDQEIRFSRAADMAGNAIDKAKQTADKAMGKDFPRAASMPDLNDDQRSLLGKVGASQSPASDAIKAATDRAGLKIRQGMVDRFAALKELDEKALGQNFIADAITNSAWVLAKMSSAGSGALNAMMKTGRIEMDAQQKVIGLKGAPNGGLTASLQKLGGPAEVERFFAWVAANRAEKLMGEGRENLFTPAEIAAGKTLNTGNTEDGKVRPALYSQVHAEFQQYRDDVLAIAEQAGIINGENRAMWRDEFYVPFYRVMEDDADRGRSGGNGLSRQEAYKKLKGGKQNLNDLMENTLMNFHHLLSASLKNQAAVQAIKNAEHVGIARKVPEAHRDTKASTFVLVDGKKVFYEVDDPLVFESITTLADPGLNNTAVRVMGAFKRLFTNMTTATPQFIIANTFRDLLQASATSPTSKNIAKNLKEGIQSYRDEKTRAEMLASGGAFSFGHIYGMGADEVKESLQKTVAGAGLISSQSMIPSILRKGWDAWSNITDLSENASRAATYTQNVEQMGKLRAAFEARDVMDFSQHGAWPAVRLLVRIVPFLNARLQGLDKLYRSGLKPSILTAMGKGTDTDKQAAARFAMVTGALTLATMALYLINADDDEYKKLEEWQKDTYWFIRIGENAFFLPKPFEVGAIATMAERTLQQAMDDKATGKLFRERMWEMLMQTFAFNPTPQMFQPLIDVYSNKDAFTGRDIESAGMERMSTGLRSRDTTTAPATALSAVSRVFGDESSIAVSPVQADHLIKGYLGGVGATAAGWIDTMYRAATGQSSPGKAWAEYQPIRRFYRDLDVPVANTRYTTLFYDGLKEANRVYADVMELQRLGRTEEAEALAAEKRNPLQMRIALNAQQRRMTEINNRMKEVRRSDKDGEWKRRELDLLTTQKAMITERMGKRIEDARAGA